MEYFSLLYFLLTLLCNLNLSQADVSIAKPSAGQTFTATGGSVTVDVTWQDDGADPAIKGIQSYSFTLCTGANNDITAVSTLDEGKTIKDNKYTATIPASAGGDGVYYIQIYAVYSSGYTIHYSRRFKLSGMSGTTKASGSLSDGPPNAQISVKTATTTDYTATMDVSASFSVVYTKQTGIIRFAPMQLQPGSSVTATTWTRQFPTSAVTYFSTIAPTPKQISTITAGWSYTKTSLINYASALGTPTAWYAPSKKLKKPTLTSDSSATASAKKKRFWDLD